MSGRAAGRCGGFGLPGYASAGFGRGRGRGFGRGGGRGFGARWRGGAGGATPSDAEAERQVLKRQADALRAQLQVVESRLAEEPEGREESE
jgi:hypothetical protein